MEQPKEKSYKIIFQKTAVKELNSLAQREYEAVKKAILSLAYDPIPHGVKSLKGKYKEFYRIRQGNYKIVYQINNGQLIITIIRIGDRKDVYQ